MTEQRPPRVFISYSHDSVEHQARVLDFADRLRVGGIDAEIDQYNTAPPEDWPLWCERQIEAADFVLMVCTETYYRRVTGNEERGKGLGVVWEARIIRQLLYDAGAVSDKFVLVLFSDASPEQIPTPIKGWTRYVVDTENGYQELYRRLTGQPRLLRPALGKIHPMPTRRRQWSEGTMEAASSSSNPSPPAPDDAAWVRRVTPLTAQRQLDTPALLDDLANPDPLVCFPAAKALKGRSDLGEKLIDIYSSTRVVKEAVRTVIGTFPGHSATILLAAIKHCGPTGDSWGRAHRASHYFMVDHSPYAEEALVDLVQRTGNIEVERHSLTSLGNMGRLAFYSPDVDQMLRCDYGYQKCFDYALKASALNFTLARDDFEIHSASRLLLDLIDVREKRRGSVTSYSLALGACGIQHVDEILTTWLGSGSDRVKELGLRVLGRLRVARSASGIEKLWRNRWDDDVGKEAASTLWCIGEPNSLKTLLKNDIHTIAGEGLMYLDDESFERFLPQVLAISARTWLAYRAVGLRQRKDKLSLLRRTVSHRS